MTTGTRTPRLSAIALVAIVVALVAAACGGGDDALTVYSGRSEELVGPLFEQFTDETGIEVDVRYGNSGDLALLIGEEGDNTPADVFYSQSPGAVAFLAADDRLDAIATETLEVVDPRFRGADGLWVGVSGRQRVLVYNSDLVDEDELPASVFDLTDERFRGEVAIAPSNGSFQDFVTAMRQIDGEDAAREWLEAMAANDAPTYANNSSIVEAVGRGEVPLGLVNHYYNFRFLEEDASLPSRNHVFAAGDTGGLVISSSASIIKGTDMPDEALQLIEFLLAEDAQTYFAEETFEYPLRPGVDPPVDVAPLADLRPPDYDIGGATDLEGTAVLIRDSGLE
ncbi:MAG: iron ABC transporter substrate-binding protein [Miltoncostaeaceae bacterium]